MADVSLDDLPPPKALTLDDLPAPPASKPSLTLKDYLAALPETAASLGSGAVASLAGGLSSAGANVENAGRWVLNKFGANLPGVDPAAGMQQIQRDLTYQPRTQGGQQLTDLLLTPARKYSDLANMAGEKTSDVTGSPFLGSAVNTGIQALPYAAGSFVKGSPAKAPAALTPEVAQATNAGLKLTPEQAGGALGKITQSLTGSAKLERSISKQNAPTVNNLVAQDLSLPKLTQSAVAAAKAAPNAVYDEVAKLGKIGTDAQYQSDIGAVANKTGAGSFAFDVPKGIEDLKSGYAGVQSFDAADAVAKVRQLRRDSSANIGARYNPEQQALGYAQRQVADALDDQLARFADQNGKPGLMDRLTAARQQLAKINTAQRAMKGDNIVASRLAKQAPLSGNMRVVANAYNNFDRSLQDVSKIRDSGPFGVLDLGFGAAAGLAHPGALSAVLARPLARGALASDAYQRYGIRGGQLPALTLQDLLRGSPLLATPPPQGLLEQQ